MDAFRRRYAARFGLDDARFSPALVEAFASRAWPGNAREVENAVARLLALSEGGLIDETALGRLDGAATSVVPGKPDASPELGDPGASSDLRGQVAAFERGIIERVLGEAGGNQSETARRLGVTRMTLIDKMKRHGLGGKGG